MGRSVAKLAEFDQVELSTMADNVIPLPDQFDAPLQAFCAKFGIEAKPR